MKKSLLEIYALAVCFITIACFVVTLGIALYALVGIADPEFTLNSYQFAQYQTNDQYWRGCGIGNCVGVERKGERPAEADLTRQREEAFARALSNERRESSQTLVKSLIVLLVDSAVFAVHWVIARHARSSSA